jgi:hypothetical protein
MFAAVEDESESRHWTDNSVGRSSTGADGRDQTIQLAEKTFRAAYAHFPHCIAVAMQWHGV